MFVIKMQCHIYIFNNFISLPLNSRFSVIYCGNACKKRCHLIKYAKTFPGGSMKTLFKGGSYVNVFTDQLIKADVLVDGGIIAGVGSYEDNCADEVVDAAGRILCPGFVDGHIHIESTMLTPPEFVKAILPHGTTTVIADPHEIANVCGVSGLDYMIEQSIGLPVDVLFALPSCVPAGPFDENGAMLNADALKPFYGFSKVVALGEVMNYPGVLAGDGDLLRKISDARAAGRVVNGHAPMLTGNDLNGYVRYGITDDHECTQIDEAKERIEKGQTVMIRQGTAAKNLEGLFGLFEEPYNRNAILATDDKHPADLISTGHVDAIIRRAVELGASPFAAVRMATIQACRYFRLYDKGAIAPGYRADIAMIDDLTGFNVSAVWKDGKKVAENGTAFPVRGVSVRNDVLKTVLHSFNIGSVTPESFRISPKGSLCRLIELVPGQLLTNEAHEELDFSVNNGIDESRDIIKLAVMERHMQTGHIGLGFIKGLGIKNGAIASSVSHDSHNLIVAGTSDADLAAAANAVIGMNGGLAVVCGGKVVASLPLPVAGLMSLTDAAETARLNHEVRQAVHKYLGVNENIEPFMNTAFVSLTVIPSLKMTTLGLCDVDRQKLVDLFV